MANTLLSPTIITREALRILHALLSFIQNVNRQYDNQFANEGASPSGKIGPTLTIRLPNQFTVRSGSLLQVQDVTEASTTLTVSTQKGVDINFSATDLTLTIDDFAQRYLKPAMAVLASTIEADALSMVKDVYLFQDHDAAALAFDDLLAAQEYLTNSLTPQDGDRCLILPPYHNRKFVNAVTGTYNPQVQIGEQWKRGMIAADTAGFDKVYQNTLLTAQATGTAAKVTGYSIDSAGTVEGTTITVKTGTDTFKKGDVITIATQYAVHPETKATLRYLQPQVVTEDYAGGAGSLKISPGIVSSGAKQNVSAAIAADQLIVKVGAGASETYIQSLGFHKDAFAFVTADLIDVAKFGAWGSRQVQDGISLRIARQYDITNDKIPTRMDVLYGYKTVRPQLACRIHADG